MSIAFQVVRAGAGSGKTTYLCHTVVDAVIEGLDPSRLLATTFTRKAAAELKARILRLLRERLGGNHPISGSAAERLELAAIGTVHSVALQFIQRYAIALGCSPRLNVLTEAGRVRALRELLAGSCQADWRDFEECARRFSFSSKQQWQQLLELLDAKRGNRLNHESFEQQLSDSAVRLCELLGGGIGPRVYPHETLFEYARQAQEHLRDLNDTTTATNDARKTLQQLLARESTAWSIFARAAQLSAGKKSGAHQYLETLRAYGAGVGRSQELHADVINYAKLVAHRVIDLESRYCQYKAERGLVDFSDLEVQFLELLERPDLADSLRQDFELVLVDEFQDTNPLQLAIFQRLRDLAARSLWVGDPQQAIYGFRGTDPELVDRVWHSVPEDSRTALKRNYRSQSGLVRLAGRLFQSKFGDHAVQEPDKQAQPRAVERWLLNTTNQENDAQALASGIAALHAEGAEYGHIAVLERKNQQLEILARTLNNCGIPCLLESPGLLSTREGALVLAGLQVVADRTDALAAARILHILGDPQADTPGWLEERLISLQAKQAEVISPGTGRPATPLPWEREPRLAALRNIDRQSAPPAVIMLRVLEALNIPELLAAWGDVSRRNSHLDSLLQHVEEYESNAAAVGSEATLTGLIVNLQKLAEEGRDIRHPTPGNDAVTLTTYHSAKGLEWPIVILGSLDLDLTPDMWSPMVTGGGSDQKDPLRERKLRFWTWPFGVSDGPFPKPLRGTGLEDEALDSEEGRQRATRERLEGLRLLYVGVTRAQHKLVFAQRHNHDTWSKQLPEFDAILGTNREEGEYDLPELGTTLVIRHLGVQTGSISPEPASSSIWFSRGPIEEPFQPEVREHFPHEVPAVDPAPSIVVDVLLQGDGFSRHVPEERSADLGNAVHAYLAAMPSSSHLPVPHRETVAQRCLSAFGVSEILAPRKLVAVADRFAQWVDFRYPGSIWHSEIQVTAPRSRGGQWRGVIDLVLQLPNGQVVIIDHKSAPIARDHCSNRALEYSGQLQAYDEILTATGESVAALWIHFPLAGAMAQIVR